MTELTRERFGDPGVHFKLEYTQAAHDHCKRLKVVGQDSIDAVNYHLACRTNLALLTGWEPVDDPNSNEYQTIVYLDE